MTQPFKLLTFLVFLVVIGGLANVNAKALSLKTKSEQTIPKTVHTGDDSKPGAGKTGDSESGEYSLAKGDHLVSGSPLHQQAIESARKKYQAVKRVLFGPGPYEEKLELLERMYNTSTSEAEKDKLFDYAVALQAHQEAKEAGNVTAIRKTKTDVKRTKIELQNWYQKAMSKLLKSWGGRGAIGVGVVAGAAYFVPKWFLNGDQPPEVRDKKNFGICLLTNNEFFSSNVIFPRM